MLQTPDPGVPATPTIVRQVTVDRSLPPQAVFENLGRKHDLEPGVVKRMPQGMGADVEVTFFKLGFFISHHELAEEYAKRGLQPADPVTLAAVNAADPEFASRCPNATHWQDPPGVWSIATFYEWNKERKVAVGRDDYIWHHLWWFAGVRKTD